MKAIETARRLLAAALATTLAGCIIDQQQAPDPEATPPDFGNVFPDYGGPDVGGNAFRDAEIDVPEHPFHDVPTIDATAPPDLGPVDVERDAYIDNGFPDALPPDSRAPDMAPDFECCINAFDVGIWDE